MIDMKRIITLFLALMALALTLTACGKVEQYDTSATDDTPIVYKTADGEELTLDVLLPTNRKRMRNPTVIVLHGGGWISGSTEDFCREFAVLIDELRAEGICVVPVNYRLAVNGRTWSDCLEDCGDALDYLIAHAEEYDIDTERLGVIGYSAGAQLGLLTAIGRDDIKYCASLSAPVTFSDNPESPYYSEVLGYYTSQAFGASIDSVRYDASPVVRLTRRCGTSFLMVNGLDDDIVSPQHAELFCREADSLGVDVELIEQPGLTHFYSAYPDNAKLMEKVADRVIRGLF